MQYQNRGDFKKALAMGVEGEEQVCSALLRMGVTALPLFQFSDEIAPKIVTATARFSSPDLICFGRKGAFFVEVKTKNSWSIDRKSNLLVTGVNKRLWDDYKAIQDATGIPVYIAFNHRSQAPEGVFLIGLDKYNNVWDGLNRVGERVAQVIVQYAFKDLKKIG